MATRKSILILLGVLMISAWVLGSVIQAGAETMKWKYVGTATKDESISVPDQEGHFLGLQIMEGLGFFENGEIAKARTHAIYDRIIGKGAQAIVYTILTFDDGSTIVSRLQRLIEPGQTMSVSATNTGELIKGTGRFEGIKGTLSATGRQFPPTKGEPARAANDVTFTYTLPVK